MLNEIKEANAHFYKEPHGTLLFFVLALIAWLLVVPHLDGMLLIIFSAVWGFVMWYGAVHASRLENAGSLNHDRSNWKV